MCAGFNYNTETGGCEFFGYQSNHNPAPNACAYNPRPEPQPRMNGRVTGGTTKPPSASTADDTKNEHTTKSPDDKEDKTGANFKLADVMPSLFKSKEDGADAENPMALYYVLAIGGVVFVALYVLIGAVPAALAATVIAIVAFMYK